MPDIQERGKVLADTVMRNLYLTAQVESQQEEIRALHEVLRAINTSMSKYEDDIACLSGYTVVAPPQTAAE
jgi:ABC-type iron transport system FetAB ATPase subunit